ncbi:hypothetical protein OAJ34_00835 [Candidatus Nitrosopelagicus sp.]|nr:hypothetical protein [Candidatus Nitrosopelagicus sp.]
MHKLPFLIILTVGISFIPLSFSEDIPEWVKNNASWWSERQISQTEFTNGLEFLINEGIIYIPPTEPGSPGPDKIIPDWVRNTAGWWSDNKIPDSEFINAMKYLIEIGLIEVDASSPEVIEEETVEEIIEPNATSGTPLLMLLEGYNHVHTDGKYVLDVLIFDADKYPNASPTFNRNAAYTVDSVSIDILLYNEEGLIHSYSGLTKNGFLRYDVMAKETEQKGTLWMINNLYTVNIRASLDEQTVEKQIEFLGQASAYAYNAGSVKSSTAAFDLSYASYSGKSLDVNPPAATPEGLIFSPDGKKMFISDNTGSQIEEFTLSTAWDINSASDAESPLNITQSGGNIEDIAFNSDGTKLFVVDRSNSMILEYTLAGAYDISEETYAGNGARLDMSSELGNAEDLAFNTSGSVLFVLENQGDDMVIEYSCSTVFDVSTCSHASSDLTLVDGSGTNLDASDAFEFSSDGTTMYIADPGNDLIQQYALDGVWDVSTARHVKTFDISSQEPAARGLAFGQDGNRLYVTGTSDTVWQYNLDP